MKLNKNNLRRSNMQRNTISTIQQFEDCLQEGFLLDLHSLKWASIQPKTKNSKTSYLRLIYDKKVQNAFYLRTIVLSQEVDTIVKYLKKVRMQIKAFLSSLIRAELQFEKGKDGPLQFRFRAITQVF